MQIYLTYDFYVKKDAYGCGADEIPISEILKDCRDEAFVYTLFGIIRDQNPNGGIRS